MTLAEVWFVLILFMLTAYVVLDGFDLGAGILHLFVARNNAEREMVLRTVGPVWDGNEVWLIAAGGTLMMAFPTLIATSFSGFYLPLMIILWLLVFRALGIELRHHVEHPLWRQFWDVAFALSSLLLTVFFGAALGNVVRGVAFDGEGRFFAPLWTNFKIDPEPGILDWYTLCVSLMAVAAITLHGALWLVWRTGGEVQRRSRRCVKYGWFATLALTAIVTAATAIAQPQMVNNLRAHLAWWFGPALAVAGLFGAFHSARHERWPRAFIASSAFLAGMLMSAAAAVHPFVLPSRGAADGLTLAAAATEPYALRVALYWWIPGILLTLGYFVVNYRSLSK